MGSTSGSSLILIAKYRRYLLRKLEFIPHDVQNFEEEYKKYLEVKEVTTNSY